MKKSTSGARFDTRIDKPMQFQRAMAWTVTKTDVKGQLMRLNNVDL